MGIGPSGPRISDTPRRVMPSATISASTSLSGPPPLEPSQSATERRTTAIMLVPSLVSVRRNDSGSVLRTFPNSGWSRSSLTAIMSASVSPVSRSRAPLNLILALSVTCPTTRSMTICASRSLLSKRRNTVVRPTPAARAMSSIEVRRIPSSAKHASAASTIRSPASSESWSGTGQRYDRSSPVEDNASTVLGDKRDVHPHRRFDGGGRHAEACVAKDRPQDHADLEQREGRAEATACASPERDPLIGPGSCADEALRLESVGLGVE